MTISGMKRTRTNSGNIGKVGPLKWKTAGKLKIGFSVRTFMCCKIWRLELNKKIKSLMLKILGHMAHEILGFEPQMIAS